MSTYFNIAQIIISAALVTIIVFQSQTSGLGGLFGGSGGAVHRKRRGVERTLFIITIVLAVVFFVISLVNTLVQGTA
ncbi:MAG: preprotein translocase subunit SecG [Anaerolineae bacterium]|jgi:preprotein translocase subunit SecG